MDEFGINSGYVAELLDRYLRNPDSVDEGWRAYFRDRLGGQSQARVNGNGTANGHAARAASETAVLKPPAEPPSATTRVAMSVAEVQGRVSQLINAYRVRGHLFARVDPLRLEAPAPPQLELGNFDLSEEDLDRTL